MAKKFNPSPAALRASIREFPDGCTTRIFQATNLRYAFCLGYKAAQQAARKRKRSTNDVGGDHAD